MTQPTRPRRTRPSGTFLTHLFGNGLDDDARFTVERFTAMASGEIRPAGTPGTMSRRAVRGMRPARNEIILCTGTATKASGVQFWGACATGLFYPHGRKM